MSSIRPHMRNLLTSNNVPPETASLLSDTFFSIINSFEDIRVIRFKWATPYNGELQFSIFNLSFLESIMSSCFITTSINDFCNVL